MSGEPWARGKAFLRRGGIRQHCWAAAIVLVSIAGASHLAGQEVQPAAPDSVLPTLSIEQAVGTALDRNPDFLKVGEARRGAAANVLDAYGAFLPSINGSLGMGYQKSGSQLFDGTRLGASSDLLTSSYSVGVGLNLSGTTFITPSVARASRDAADADVLGQGQTLRTSVIDQYLTVLEADALAALRDTLLLTAQTQLDLARGKASVGTGTALEVQQAQVVVGQQQVAQLQAYSQADIERLKLYQQMGVDAPSGLPRVRLTTLFTVTPFPLTLDSVLAIARLANPPLLALRSRERVARFNVSLARSQYAPTFGISTGIGGYASQYADGNYPVQQALAGADAARASCDSAQSLRAQLGLPSDPSQCTAITITPAQVAAIRRQNKVFPFGFTPNPFSISASLSLPIFNGFTREVAVEQALVSRNSARYDVRARELQLTTDVSTAYLTLQTAERTAAVQVQTAAQAHTALTFIQQRYKVGLATFVDVAVARDTYENAENARITSVYDYFKSVADLEGAVGRPLGGFGTP